jgi:serine/threonine protein kinase
MDLTVENICGLLIRSRLMTVDEVKAMYARWLAEPKTARPDVSQFLRWLVAQQYLTEYQAGRIGRGHTDHFFLNDYKILDRLGQGRMGGVFKAVHSLGQVVAIKVLPPSKAKDEKAFGRFQRESRLAMRLNHPNIVRTFQTGKAGRIHYLVMEYLDGETLEAVLQRRGPLPPAEGVRLIYQALRGLQHMHEQGLIHRDLKPSNLMLVHAPSPYPLPPRGEGKSIDPSPPAGEGRVRGPAAGQPDTTLQSTVKILDIGLGRVLVDESAPAEVKKQDQLTTENVMMGTPDYLAPEQARNARAADIRADIYSLGCVLYEVLAGQPPFPDTNLLSQVLRHATETPRPLHEFNPAVPDGLQQIVNWMMAKEPDQRYPTPERAAQALQVFLAAGAEPPPVAEAESKVSPYLSWLEKDVSSQEAAAAASGESPKDTGRRPSKVTPIPPTRSGDLPVREARHRSSKTRHRHHARRMMAPIEDVPQAVAPVPPPAEPAADVDVELVPALPLQEVAVSWRGLVLTRRDLFMLGIGAGSVAAAGLIGMAVAQLSSRKGRTNPPAEPEAPEEKKQETDS